MFGTKLGPFLNLTTLNIFIWSKSYGKSLLEPIIAELSLYCYSFTSSLARALKFSVLGHGGLPDKTMEYQTLMITPKLYLTLFVLAVLQGYVEHQNFEEWINWIQVIKP